MFLQQKEYTQLFRGAEKLMTAGLCKQIIWDQKIRIDYFMEHLPVPEGTMGRIRLFYLVRSEQEQGLIRREVTHPMQFSKSKIHYTMTQRERAENRIIKIDNCVMEFDGDYTVRLLGHPGIIKDLRADAAGKTAVSVPDNGAAKEAAAPVPDNDAAEKTAVQKEDGDDGLTEASAEKENRSRVRRIDDLKMLLEMGQQCVSLYYNSFLLHSFYQYRHVLLGDGFLGVPDYFYEREAIAAKMMGFSYFVEAKDIDNVSFEEGTPAGMPKDGAYGYFLCRLQSQ